MRIAFYAPLKSPDHAVPSGDREMARMLMAALRSAGHEVFLASQLRTYSPEPEPELLAGLHVAAAVEVEALFLRMRSAPPDLWFTYHPYYKAPDLLGPAVARSLGLPYATAEASHAGKRERDAWGDWQRPVTDALRRGTVHFCLTPVDHDGLSRLLGGDETLVDLPPFVDIGPFVGIERRVPSARLELLTVAMMRRGKKVRSYQFLAAALRALSDLDWRLTVVGDGEALDTVTSAFAPFPEPRVRWRGAVEHDRLPAEYAAADLFVWPGFEEDYGMVYLEAQAAGLPVVALASDGVRQVVRHGETGLLVDGESVDSFAAALRAVLADEPRRNAMARAAHAFVTQERSLANAAGILDRGLKTARSVFAASAANFRHEAGMA